MIRLPSLDTLTCAERYGLEILVDLARLPAVDDEAAGVVRLEVTPPGADGTALPVPIADAWPFERGDGVVRIPRFVLRHAADLAGAAAEQRTETRDRHDRVPSADNVIVQAGAEGDAVVSRAGARLRQAVIDSAGRRAVLCVAPWPDGKRWAAAFTHDLDVVAFWPLFTALRLAELARKGQVRLWGRTVAAGLAAVGRDPVGQGVRTVLETERRYGVVSTWFVLCGTPTLATIRAGDLTYRPESRAARAIVRELVEGGCEVGLHGSFATSDRHELFREQRLRLERLTGRPAIGVRQHFLRMRPGPTQQGMLAGGFRYDATYGFPDRNGFRLGVADVIPAWDAESERVLGLEEVPLCWMDRALSKYRGVEQPERWVSEGLALAATCRAVEGLWVGVWHPNLTPALGYPGAPPAFAELVRRIVADDPFVATLEAIVTWRRARRGLRIRRVAPDGRLESYTNVPAPAPLDLEDPAGRVAATVRG